jgi:catechol 2,3-dioxygenase-like lactoylglutathione lyase family enzyme
MQIRFISGFAPIVADPQASERLYVDTIGLPLERYEDTDYYRSESIEGAKHFGLWQLSEAARSCFGTDAWPADRPVPQACVEFDVDSADAVADAVRELEAAGYVLVHGARTEPWGQTIARLQTPEGLLVGISFAPWHHRAAES